MNRYPKPDAVRTVIIPLCCGRPNGEDLTTYLRFVCAVSEYKPKTGPKRLPPPNLQNSIVLYTAGYSKDSPRKPSKEYALPMCREMVDRLQRELHPWKDRTFAELGHWGTESEIRDAFRIIRRQGFGWKDRPLEVIISTNKAHMPRVKLYVNRYKNPEWQITYKVAKHRFSAKSGWREIIGYIPELIRIKTEAIWLRYFKIKNIERIRGNRVETLVPGSVS